MTINELIKRATKDLLVKKDATSKTTVFSLSKHPKGQPRH
jgi:hypothetical protein